MKCSVCYGRGKIRGGKVCLMCSGTGQTADFERLDDEVDVRSRYGTVTGSVVAAAIGLAVGGFSLQAAISFTNSGFIFLAALSFIVSGLIGGLVSERLARDGRSFWQHVSLPATISFLVNFAGCTIGVYQAF